MKRKHYFFIGFLFGIIIFLLSIGSLLVAKNEPVKADAIVILMGDLEERGKFAADLYNRKYGNKIFIATPSSYKKDFLNKYGIHVEDDIDVMKKLLINLGVGQNDIYCLDQITENTIGEARVLLDHLHNDTSIKSVLVATSSYHSARAKHIFNSYAKSKNNEIEVCVPLNKYSTYNFKYWFYSKKDIQITFLESTKWLVYILYYQWTL
ncbi:YdcF family protein [Flavihumibacter sp. RY-1]|uniref:YdcF family protein n=1 Tax=Flavihumibacter fluminis TaxID=2909236 RepID=A0ABS9BMD7_9BACT|nr:YdcF family protein [Flavihumibacter fluminis]MCF1716374.1 YdcF family protein [Flavihumibacter fluminis]